MAIGFKLAFSVQNEEYQREFRRREKLVHMFGAITFLLLLGFYVVIHVLRYRDHVENNVFTVLNGGLNLTVSTIITGILIFSLFRIRKYTKMLV